MKVPAFVSLLVALTCAGIPCSSLAREAFTVSDSIALRHLTDPNGAMAPYAPQTFKLSPDGKTLVIVTRRGDLDSGLNEFTVSALDTSAIIDYVNDSRSPVRPDMKELTTIRTSSLMDGIDRVTWLKDGHRLAFIGRDRDRPGQIYAYDLRTQALTRLTEHGGNIVRFAFSDDGMTLLYAAEVVEDWTLRNRYGYAVESEYPDAMSLLNPQDAVPDMRFFARDLGTGVTSEVQLSTSKYASDDMAVSRSGKHAVLVHYDLRVADVPASWVKYSAVKSRMEFLTPPAASGAAPMGGRHNDALGRRSNWFGRRLLIDMKTGTASLLYDAPVVNDGRAAIISWAPNEDRVLIGPMLLPMDVSDERHGAEAASAEFIAEVQISTKKVTPVTRVPAGTQVDTLGWLNASTVRMQCRDSNGEVLPPQAFAKASDVWRSAPRALSLAKQTFRLLVRQDANTPPEIAAEDLSSGRTRVVTDLNPQLSELDLGRVEPFKWRDTAQREFTGGLLLPRAYQQGVRYPAVLQTYGFNPNAFLVDGPFGVPSAYAARALASSGFVVLQMDTRVSARTSCANWEPCGENPTFVRIVESAIDALDAKGLIDRERVGLIGWSREGMHVFHALAFGKYHIAAATVADSIAFSPFGYAMAYGSPGILEFERMLGGVYWGENRKLWQERSPALNLERLNTPLRLERYGNGISNYWDVFALLKRQGRPVELYHIPRETHILQTPLGRYASQQGNVDWFRFWLKGEEDQADERKRAQYERWRELRADYDVLRSTVQSE